MTDPHVPRIAGGRLYGRGAYDMWVDLGEVEQCARTLAAVAAGRCR